MKLFTLESMMRGIGLNRAAKLGLAVTLAALPVLASQGAAHAQQVGAMAPSCSTWIDNAWGKAQCYNDTGSPVQFRITVVCVDFWDPDVTNYATASPHSSVTLAGNCWGAVESVSAGPA